MQTTADQQLDQIKLAARLYYADDLPQTEVARVLAVSQAKVSRLLQAARDKGVVQITVGDYEPRNAEIEARLKGALGLHRAVVVRKVDSTSAASIRRKVGYFGAQVAVEEIQSAKVVGLTGGRTLAELVRHINRLQSVKQLEGLQVVQLMGNIGAEVNSYDSIEISRSVANLFGGSFYTLNSPAFASSAESKKAFLNQEQIKEVWKLYGKMDLAIVGIGSLSDSAFIEREVLSTTDLERLRSKGAIGEICGRYFDSAGEECQSTFRDRVVSIQLDELKRLPRVLGITSGADRAEAVLAAVRGGLVDSLIIDEEGAQAVLERAAEKTRSTPKNVSRNRFIVLPTFAT